MEFGLGLPGLTFPAGGFPIKTEIPGISGPVSVTPEKTTVYKPEEEKEVVPGVPSINTTTVKGKVSDMWQQLLMQFGMNALTSKSDSGSGMGDLVKVPWDMKAAPSVSSAQGGTSGDITGGVNYGDIVAKGLKFDLTSVPSWFWLVAAVSSGAGLLFLMKSSKKGKK